MLCTAPLQRTRLQALLAGKGGVRTPGCQRRRHRHPFLSRWHRRQVRYSTEPPIRLRREGVAIVPEFVRREGGRMNPLQVEGFNLLLRHASPTVLVLYTPFETVSTGIRDELVLTPAQSTAGYVVVTSSMSLDDSVAELQFRSCRLHLFFGLRRPPRLIRHQRVTQVANAPRYCSIRIVFCFLFHPQLTCLVQRHY